jgi:arsenite methyltransferase
MLRDAGFEQVAVEQKTDSAEYIKQWVPGSGAEKFVVSANITAVKPGARAAAPLAEQMPSRMRTAAAKAAEKKAGC